MENDVSTPEVALPMEAPTIFLLVLGIGAAVLLTGLMRTDLIWSGSHPVTLAQPASQPPNIQHVSPPLHVPPPHG